MVKWHLTKTIRRKHCLRQHNGPRTKTEHTIPKNIDIKHDKIAVAVVLFWLVSSQLAAVENPVLLCVIWAGSDSSLPLGLQLSQKRAPSQNPAQLRTTSYKVITTTWCIQTYIKSGKSKCERLRTSPTRKRERGLACEEAIRQDFWPFATSRLAKIKIKNL